MNTMKTTLLTTLFGVGDELLRAVPVDLLEAAGKEL